MHQNTAGNIVRLLAGVIISSVAIGCVAPEARSMSMGNVTTQRTFTVARKLLGEHFKILKADPDKHTITTTWRYNREVDESIFATTIGPVPVRKQAMLKVRRVGDQTWVDLRIHRQRQKQVDPFTNPAYMQDIWDSSDSRPLTPAMTDGPYSPEQQQLWKDDGCDLKTEQAILENLYLRLNR